MVYQDPGPGAPGGGGTTDVAKEEAGRVGQKATEAGGQVAQTTKDQAQQVVGEARQQARDLVGEARSQVRDQAGTQRDRAVQGLRTLSDELDQMAQQGGQSGLATEVARQLSGRTRDLAGHLERNEPSDLLEQLRSYARRRPVVFLTGAALAGVVAGRLTKSIAAGAPGGGSRELPSGNGYRPVDPLAVGAGGYTSPDYPAPAYGTTAGTGAAVGVGSDYATAPADYGSGGFREPDAGPADSGYRSAPEPGRESDTAWSDPEPDPEADAGYGSELGFPPASGGPGYPSPSIAPYEPEQPPARGWTP